LDKFSGLIEKVLFLFKRVGLAIAKNSLVNFVSSGSFFVLARKDKVFSIKSLLVLEKTKNKRRYKNNHLLAFCFEVAPFS